ncbi:MAG: hypothetical protein V1903_11435 [Bacteroidota bacterium]
MKTIKVILLLLVICPAVFCQETISTADTLRKDALNVFMTASDYVKKEIPFINYVRDRRVADVYIISTYESAGSGGTVVTFFIVGQGNYRGMADTIKCNISPDDTYDMQRAKEVKALKMGLMRYVAKTPLAQFMNINFTEPLSETVSTDKWNSWVYSASMNAYSNSQKTVSYGYIYGYLSANRITEKSKFQSSFGMDFQKDTYEYEDTTYISSISDYFGEISYVKSLNDHWSVGGTSYAQSSTYSNFDLSVRVTPGIEYDIFPYSESTRRILTISYRAGVEINNYSEETTRQKMKETLVFHSLTAGFKYIQKWGSINTSLVWSNYFFDWSYNKLRLYTSASLRIIKGLSFNIYGSASLVHDQISLPIGDTTLEDVLLRRKMQATDYQYYTSFGFTYTFGSIYNNAVNPRFDF